MDPTGKTVRPAWLIAIFSAVLASGANAAPRDELQAIGARVSALAAQPRTEAEAASTIADIRTRLAAIHAAVAVQRSLAGKYRAIAAQLDALEHTLANGPSSLAEPARVPRIEREVVSARHGGQCSSALGLHEGAAVQAMVGGRGAAANDVWFRFEPPRDASYAFRTHSAGPDPDLQAFVGGCHGRADAENDDAEGLDARLAIAGRRGEPVFLHVTNSGSGGAIAVDAVSSAQSIAGTITDAATGQPIANATVSIRSTTLFYYNDSTAETDVNGYYLAPVNAGSYYVYVFDYEHTTSVYPGAQCGYTTYAYDFTRCSLAGATVVDVADGTAVTGINVALLAGQMLSGNVRDGANQPIYGAVVYLYDGTGLQLDSDYTDSLGRYSFSRVPTGSYKLAAIDHGHGSQMYNHSACAGPLQDQCDLDLATTIGVATQDVAGLNFNLPMLAAIQGHVDGPGSFGANVCVLDAQGNPTDICGSSDANGNYVAGPLSPGTYYAYARANGYFSQIYAGIDCAASCIPSVASATALVVTQQGQVLDADFHLLPLPLVHGHVQDSISGLPLANVAIYASVLAPAGYSSAYTTTDALGNYTLSALPAGNYYVLAVSNDHLDRMYPDVPCEQYNPSYSYPSTPCDVSGAIQLAVTPAAILPALDFALPPAAKISGHAATRAGPGSDLPASVSVEIYDAGGTDVSSASSDALGNYVVNDLPPGTYFAEAGNPYSYSYLQQVWQLLDCYTTCAPTAGTAIPAAAQATVTGVDFELTRRDAVVGRIVDDAGHPLSGVIVDLFQASSGSYESSGLTDALGYYVAAAYAAWPYFVATESADDHIDQVYAGISCPLGPAYFGSCSLYGATPVPLSSDSTQPHIVNFTLYSSDTLFSSNFER